MALISVVALAIASAARAVVRDVVAHAFHTDTQQYLVMNLPPRPDSWPGTIFTENMRLPIKRGDPNDPALLPVGLLGLAAAGPNLVESQFSLGASL